MSKAAAFAEDAVKAGWTLADHTGRNEREIVTIRHDGYDATMVMVWEGGCYTYARSSLVVQGHNRTVRNASEGRRFLSGVEAPKVTIPRKGKAKRRKRLADPAQNGKGTAPEDTTFELDGDDFMAERERRRKRLPFKVSSPAEDILKAVVGREIVWESSLSGDILAATVLPNPDQKQLRIEFNRNKKRILTFAARGEGFRSVYIESIIEVN